MIKEDLLPSIIVRRVRVDYSMGLDNAWTRFYSMLHNAERHFFPNQAPVIASTTDDDDGLNNANSTDVSFFSNATLYTSMYHLAFWYGLWCTLVWMLYRSATHGTTVLIDFKYIPAVCALVLMCTIRFDVDTPRAPLGGVYDKFRTFYIYY